MMTLIFLGSLYLAVGLCGVIGNLICIFLLASNRTTFRNVTYTYVIQLATTDCCILAGLGVYQGLVLLFEKENDMIHSFFGGLLAGVWLTGNFIMVYISISRYFSVVKRHLVPFYFSERLIKLTIFLAWIPGCLIFLSYLVYPKAGTPGYSAATAASLNYWSCDHRRA